MFEAKHSGSGISRPVAFAALAAGAMLAATPANALAMLAPDATASLTGGRAASGLFTAAVTPRAGCRAEALIEPAAAPPRDLADNATKSAAILGGAPSALDLIRLQQSGQAMLAEPPVERLAEPAPQVASAAACVTVLALVPSERLTLPPTDQGDRDTFLASSRIEIRQTALSGHWRRVSRDELAPNSVAALVQVNESSGTDRLQLVNRWVNRAIAYADDRQTWGRSDYWATAAETLARNAGDCEDLAILKYQILRAMGVEADSMYLTLVRDLVRNADHAVLVVRDHGRYYLLDNATDAILPANLAYDYRPTLSFNGLSAWLHGTTAGRDRI